MRPEFRDSTSFANRIHSGQRSQKYFSYGRMHEAGLMQQVYTIPLGARVRFSIWMQAWMCANPSACGKDGSHSDAPADMHLRVGIDPLGGTDPFTPTVVWSAEQPAWDKFVLYQVETVALSDTVTVFTHSRADWPWPRINNDVYLDDASLVIVGAYATVRPDVSLGIANPTATPFPEGAVTHTIQMGETLFDLSLKYGVQVTDLLTLNGITTSTELYVGQPLMVQIVPVTPTATATLQPAEPTATPSVTPLPSVTRPVLTPTMAVTLASSAQADRPPVFFLALVALAAVGTVVVTFVAALRVARRG
jgi:LysM repeat protein